MGFFSHKVDRDQIKPGHHIYTWRPAFTYSHHGIYVGENKVIHFTDLENASPGSAWNLSSGFPVSRFNSVDGGFSQPKCEQNCDCGSCLCTYKICGYHQPGSGVMISCLNCFTGTGPLYLYQYGVKGYVLLYRLRDGTCTTAQSGSPSDVIIRARYLLAKGFGKYDVLSNNCEDFALYCKTSLFVRGKQKQATAGSSGQVNFLKNAANGLGMLGVVPVLGNVTRVITVGFTAGKYYWDRYESDLGVRKDVVEIPVEHVVLFRGC